MFDNFCSPSNVNQVPLNISHQKRCTCFSQPGCFRDSRDLFWSRCTSGPEAAAEMGAVVERRRRNTFPWICSPWRQPQSTVQPLLMNRISRQSSLSFLSQPKMCSGLHVFALPAFMAPGLRLQAGASSNTEHQINIFLVGPKG